MLVSIRANAAQDTFQGGLRGAGANTLGVPESHTYVHAEKSAKMLSKWLSVEGWTRHTLNERPIGEVAEEARWR